MLNHSTFGLGVILSLAMLASPAFASESDPPMPPAATATATLSGEFDYDEARLAFTVNNEGPDASELAAKLAKKATGIVEALKANGVANDDIRVMGPTISVRYAVIHNSNGSETIDRQRIDGFTGNIAVNGRFKEFSTLGKAISDGVKLGAAVAGPNFALSTSSASEKLASLSVDATKQALANAKAMIEATGRKAGRVLAIHAENGGLQPLNDAPMRAMAMAVPTPDIQIPVNPGRASLSKSVTVTVEILDP